MLGRSLCPNGKSLCYLECRRGCGTVDIEALICRGTCEWTMQPSQTLSRARPRCDSSLSLFFTALWFNFEPVSVCKFRLHSSTELPRAPACALWETRAVTFIQVRPLKHHALREGIKVMSVILLFLFPRSLIGMISLLAKLVPDLFDLTPLRGKKAATKDKYDFWALIKKKNPVRNH